MSERREAWVCRHDPWGTDPDTAGYCPEAVWMVPPWRYEANEEQESES